MSADELGEQVQAHVQKLLADPEFKAAVIRNVAASAAFDGVVHSRISKATRAALWVMLATWVLAIGSVVVGFVAPYLSIDKVVSTVKAQADEAKEQSTAAVVSASAAQSAAAESEQVATEQTKKIRALTNLSDAQISSITKAAEAFNAEAVRKGVDLAARLDRLEKDVNERGKSDDRLSARITLLAKSLDLLDAVISHALDGKKRDKTDTERFVVAGGYIRDALKERE